MCRMSEKQQKAFDLGEGISCTVGVESSQAGPADSQTFEMKVSASAERRHPQYAELLSK